MKRWITVVEVAIASALVIPAAQGREEMVPLDRLPKGVLQSAQSRFKQARATGASKEAEGGKTVYEVTLKDKGRNIDVTVTPEGQLVKIEKEITAKDLPAAAFKALKEKYPKAVYRMVEEIVEVEQGKDKAATYEVHLVSADKKEQEVELSAEGRITNVEMRSDAGQGDDYD